MEQGLIEQAIRERRPLPERIQNAPSLRFGLDLYYTAFMDLTSCRPIGAGLPGPIPWLAIQAYCTINEIEGEQREDIFYFVQRLDKSYLDWSEKKSKQAMQQHAAPASKSHPKPKTRPGKKR